MALNNRKALYFIVILEAFILTFAVLIAHSLGKSQALSSSSYFDQFSMIAEAMKYIRDNYKDSDGIDTEKLIYGAIKGMTESLNDPYSQFLPPEMYKEIMDDTSGKFGGLGIEIGMTTVEGQDRLTVISTFEGNPAHKAGVEPGDYIIEIDGESTLGITLDKAKQKLRGEPGTKVTIKVLREHEEEPLSFTITRDIIQIKTVKYKILQGDVGYIKLTQFSDTTPRDIDKALDELDKAKVKGIILDLRGNPGGTLSAAVEVASDFLREGQLVTYTQGRNPEDRKEFRVQKGGPHPWHPLVVLVDRWSASGSEIVVGAIKDHKRGLIIGNEEPTFGKGSVQTIFPMADGKVGLKLTVAHYYTPSGKNINKTGIEPDIKYPSPTPSEVKMFRNLYNSKSLEEFVRTAGDDILLRLDKPKSGGATDPDRRLFDDFVKKLASENITLSESLIKLAIAQKTKNEDDEYEYNPLVRLAIEHLRALSAFNVKPLG